MIQTLLVLLATLALAWLWVRRRRASAPPASKGHSHWQVFELSFEMQGPAPGLEATYAYVLAPDASGVLPLLKAELHHRGYTLLKVIDPPRLIPLEGLDAHLARTWPEFLPKLPTRAQLLAHPAPQRVHLLPSIRAVSSPRP
jgi:hypothetical protein